MANRGAALSQGGKVQGGRVNLQDRFANQINPGVPRFPQPCPGFHSIPQLSSVIPSIPQLCGCCPPLPSCGQVSVGIDAAYSSHLGAVTTWYGEVWLGLAPRFPQLCVRTTARHNARSRVAQVCHTPIIGAAYE